MGGNAGRRARGLVVAAALSLLAAACAGGGSGGGSYDGNYDQHIAEAAGRFNMPEQWIREVIRQESGGRTMLNGRPIVSHAGAMGLMQVMPGTYQEMRRKHGLGSDPFEPRNNILAGTAYLREMYDLFGSPGFLAAYNCGPGCYGDYLAGRRTLPGETRRYLASVGPRLGAPGAGTVLVAEAAPPAPAPAPVMAPAPPAPYAAPVAAPVPVVAPTVTVAATPLAAGVWTVQLGAFRSPDDSARIIDRAKRTLPSLLDRTTRVVQPVDTADGPLFRARLAGLSEQSAAQTCLNLTALGMACFVVPPAA
ncbi:transglycosylase SLT domain-containing protein [Azospirillum sp. ST 5-10]|uniref:transglycosylase SLT domain-containing protein n=1 Tax=unclassified Azospirillum TaxID=2630922 RepID=UPI003F4A6D01